MAKISVLCQLNGGCMGCCGYDFLSKEKIDQAICTNSMEFETSCPKTEQQFLQFRDRKMPMDLRDSVCRNLIKKEELIFCPLHPTIHNGKDLRKNHCDTDFFCKTAEEFEKWEEETQKLFLSFIKEKRLDSIDYSLKMDEGLLLKEFELKPMSIQKETTLRTSFATLLK